ncbi:MAG: prepilin-type N-terminal cleavage/methylation domain-containing protein [Gemmatimonadota bacterium]|nr:prepilin-type N-terminal cleavage/methylation domain-containing protein [Gemmatimonadota bacterium]
MRSVTEETALRRGFTIIELLIVLVIIAALAAIAVPQFTTVKTKSFDAEAKADLRNMLAAEEVYFSEAQAFTNVVVPTGGLYDLDSDGIFDYQASQGVDVAVTAYTDGIQITAKHVSSPNTWCVNSSATQNSYGTPGAIVKAPGC